MPSAKPKLLFLAHLLPWPLHGGGQIKSYHTLKRLAPHFDITLLAFIRQESERQNCEPLLSLCTGGVQTVRLPRGPWQNLAAAFRAAVAGSSLFIERDASSVMQSAVHSTLQTDLWAAVHADHLQMMAFVPSLLSGISLPKIVLDQHNVEHHLLRQLAESGQGASPLLRLIARWDWSRLRRFEQNACRRADCVLAVSDEDAHAFTELIGEDVADGKVRVTPIGVDTDYFSPGTVVPGPILSVGTMYWPPNVDAVRWFSAEILPAIRQYLPDVQFQIVGAKPTQSVLALAEAQPGVVTVTGTVSDVRAFMAACGVFVVPLRAGSGMRVKILQAMAMGLPIVSTTIGAEGIAVTNEENILLADTPQAFADAVVRVLTDATLAERLGRSARALAERQYSWDVVGESLLSVYRELGLL